MNHNRILAYFFFSLLCGIFTINTYGQDPMYNQYMLNIQVYNPAYAGKLKSLSVTALTRYQWVGIDGAPSTQTLSIQSPLKAQNMGLGLTVINDRFGKENRLMLFGDYAYALKVKNDMELRLGLKGGFTNYSHDLSQYRLNDNDDDLFKDFEPSKVMLNFGVGAFLHSDEFYAGFSIPKMLQNEIWNNSNRLGIRYFNLIGGYVFDINGKMKFTPSFNARYFTQMPMVIDLNANVLVGNNLCVGVMYRTNKSLGFNTNYIINDKLRIGYAYDIGYGMVSMLNTGTHEIMISYEINFIRSQFESPRNF